MSIDLNDLPKSIQSEGAVLNTSVEFVQRRAKAREFKSARMAQVAMLPQQPKETPHYSIAAHSGAIDHVGGDFYNYFDLANGQTATLIGDVSGSGVAAAMIMSMALESFVIRGASTNSPANVMKLVSADMSGKLRRGKFLTAFYGVIDPIKHVFRYARAGHMPGILYNPIDESWQELGGQGIALGITRVQEFSDTIREYEVTVPPDSLLLLYTDGIAEAENHLGEQFGAQRLGRALTQSARLSAELAVDYIVDEMRKHTANRPLNDDFALLVIKRLAR